MRWLLLIGSGLLLTGGPDTSRAQEEQPVVYDLVIDGEAFSVESNREVTLSSKKKKGVQYKVALRLARQQRRVLNSLQFDYDLGFDVEDDGGAEVRTVLLTHELGFSLSVADLGGLLPEEARAKVLDKLTEAMSKRLEAEKVADLQVSQPENRKFKKVTAREVQFSYTDSDGFSRGGVIFVAATDKTCCTCTLEYFLPDKETALSLSTKTLGSIRAR
ncbi:MAG: hypothetical protein AB7I37_16395 [Pirellulales bacterium]